MDIDNAINKVADLLLKDPLNTLSLVMLGTFIFVIWQLFDLMKKRLESIEKKIEEIDDRTTNNRIMFSDIKASVDILLTMIKGDNVVPIIKPKKKREG